MSLAGWREFNVARQRSRWQLRNCASLRQEPSAFKLAGGVVRRVGARVQRGQVAASFPFAFVPVSASNRHLLVAAGADWSA